MNIPLEYFRGKAAQWKGFKGNRFHCEDKNLLAFTSLAAFIAWYGQPPGSEPYRDDGFYVRELSLVSMTEPKTIVEIGTALGIGTLILAMLNPDAKIFSIDNREMIPAGDGCEYPAGHLATSNGANFERIIKSTRDWDFESADLYFIDGDHSFEGVSWDSTEAFASARPGARIVWHDYNARHPGCTRAVAQFCDKHKLTLNTLPDSCTAWTML